MFRPQHPRHFHERREECERPERHEHRHGHGPEEARYFSPRRWGPFGPGQGGPFGDRPFGRGPSDDDESPRRFRRGDIKFALLEPLAEQPRHGYDLIRDLENRYGGFYRPSPGSVYPTLQMLEEGGYLVSESVDGKKVYTITDEGRKLLAERQSSAEGRRGRDFAPRESMIAMRESVAGLMQAVMQVGRHGTPAQQEEVQALLESTRRKIYGILAEEGEQTDETDA